MKDFSYMSPADITRLLNVSRPTTYNFLKAGRFTTAKGSANGRWVVSSSEIDGVVRQYGASNLLGAVHSNLHAAKQCAEDDKDVYLLAAVARHIDTVEKLHSHRDHWDSDLCELSVWLEHNAGSHSTFDGARQMVDALLNMGPPTPCRPKGSAEPRILLPRFVAEKIVTMPAIPEDVKTELRKAMGAPS